MSITKDLSGNPLRSVPSIKLALALYGMTFILMAILGVVLVVSGNESMRLGISLELLVQWGFIFFPIILVLRVRRYDLRESLNLYALEWRPLIGTLLIAPSSCIIFHQMLAWQMSILPMPDVLTALLDGVRDYGQTRTGFTVLFAATVISPCICEELLYRGVLFSALRRRLKPVLLVVAIALLFSLYHFHPYRMILLFPLGILLTYVVLRSGSIYASMLFHFIVNSMSLALILGLNQRLLPAIRYSEEGGFSMPVVVLSFFLLVIGVLMMERHSRDRLTQL